MGNRSQQTLEIKAAARTNLVLTSSTTPPLPRRPKSQQYLRKKVSGILRGWPSDEGR